MPTTITNLPGVTVNTTTTINLAESLRKAINTFHPFPFMTNQNLIDTAYKSAPTKGAVVQVPIKPVLAIEDELTTYTPTTELGLSDYETASYGKIDVKLEYALGKKFGLPSASSDFSPVEFEQMERDNMESAFRHSILPRMFRTVNQRLRTSSFATNVGATGTTMNIGVWDDLRAAVDDQGFEEERIQVRLHKDFYNDVTNLAEFQNIRGTIPTAGNNMTENTTISNTKFSVFGKYNIDFVKDQQYLRPTPASDPIGTATIATSAIVPFRGLSITDTTRQTFITDPITGLSFRYDRNLMTVNIGEVVGGRIQAYYGFKELSGDINNAGVVQTAPVFNILGGKA